MKPKQCDRPRVFVCGPVKTASQSPSSTALPYACVSSWMPLADHTSPFTSFPILRPLFQSLVGLKRYIYTVDQGLRSLFTSREFS